MLVILLLGHPIFAQSEKIAQFAVWEPKPGQRTEFTAGYQRHLVWHKTNDDKWGWYGWFIASGPRSGQFVDATLDHTWADFDTPVDPAGNRADNARNV